MAVISLCSEELSTNVIISEYGGRVVDLMRVILLLALLHMFHFHVDHL